MKIKFGAIVTDGRGKLGGHVFSKNRGGAYIRTKVTPGNPNTVFQSFIRSLLATFSAMWSNLTENQRLSFNAAVADWTTTNIFGDIKNPTGKNLFTRLNINLSNTNQANILVAPAKAEINATELVSVQYSTIGTSLDVNYDGDAEGNKILISATPPLSAGTYNYKGKFRKLLVDDGTDGGSIAIITAYTARFGAITPGDNIAISVEQVAPNGQKSVASIQKVVYLP